MEVWGEESRGVSVVPGIEKGETEQWSRSGEGKGVWGERKRHRLQLSVRREIGGTGGRVGLG